MDYPFDSFFDCCKISSSQEEFLNRCRFFREAEGSLGSFSSEEPSQFEEIPTPHPGIIICSPPDDSDEESSQSEEFRTPPEEPLRTSSDEQRGNLDERVDSRIGDATDASADDGDDSPDNSVTVELGKDSDLGFSQEKSIAEKGLSLSRGDGFAVCADISGKVHVDDVSRSELKSIEVLKEKSREKGELGFSEEKRETSGNSSSKIPEHFKENLNLESAEADGAVNVSGEPNRESLAEKKLGHLVLKTFTRPNTLRKSSKVFQKNATLAVKSNNINNRNDSHEQMGEILFGKSKEKSPAKRRLEFSNSEMDFHCTSATEVLQSADIANSRRVPKFGEGTIKEYSPWKVTEARLGLNLSTEKDSLNSKGGGDSFSNSAEGLRTFKYIEPISVVPPEIPKSCGIRRLPESICEQVKKTTEGFVSGNSSSNDQLVINLLETVNLLSGGRKHTLEDVDLLETSKRRGMTFPRPRWWRSGSN